MTDGNARSNNLTDFGRWEDAMRFSTGSARLSITLGLALVAGDAWAQGPSVSIESEYLMTLESWPDSVQPIGSAVIVNVPSGAGTVHAPIINGALVAPTGDWLYIMPEGSFRLDIRATIKTDDGELILFESDGVVVASKEVMERFNKGEVITAKDEY
jgi:hypothetical protein